MNANKHSLQLLLYLLFLIYPVLLRGQSTGKGQKRGYTISGYVTDDKSGEILIGANIFDTINKKSVATNEFGFYSITLPKGEVKLRVSFVGYDNIEREIKLLSDTLQNISLQTMKELEEVVVYGNSPDTGIKSSHIGAIEFSPKQLKSVPSILGETDIIKTMQLMPGVQAGTEGSSGLYIRGGGSDENLLLLDGIPLYNVSHLFGFFSLFLPESIKRVTLYKGSFPARYAGRLSSVIDVRTNDGDMNKLHGTVGIGLLSAKLQFEGPIIKNRTSFNISARRSYMDALVRPFVDSDNKLSYYFYDFNAKINHRFNDKHRLFLSLYKGKDNFTTDYKEDWEKYQSRDESILKWGNDVASLRWNYAIAPMLFCNTTIAYTRYQYSSINKSSQQRARFESNSDSSIKNMLCYIDFEYNPVPSQNIKFGVSYQRHSFMPETLNGKMDNGNDKELFYKSLYDSKISAHEIGGYVEDNIDISKRLNLSAGLNLSLYRVQNKSYSSLQPRLSVKYKINNDLALSGAYSLMSQNAHLLSSYAMMMPSDLWVPTTKQIKPMRAVQYSIGANYTGIKKWEFSIEAYYKTLRNVLEYRDGATFMSSAYNWDNKVEMGKGRAMGIELLAQKKTGKLTGWLAYTWAKNDRRFENGSINGGNWFPYKYDRRHNLNLTMNYMFSKKIDLSATWEFHTGGTATVATQSTLAARPDYDIDPSPVVDYIGQRNNYRMPCSHQLSLGINFNKKTKYGMRTWNISLYNVYNAMNPTFIYREKDGENRSVMKKITIFPLMPSVSYTYKF